MEFVGIKDYCDIEIKDIINNSKVVVDVKGTFIDISDTVQSIRIEDSLKIDVKESVYESLKNDSCLQENFNLKVKRLNRWWYSIYFEKKKGK